MIKRLLDMILSAAGILIATPILIIAAIAIKLDTKGPVIFSQERIGRHFGTFRIYKLRSMTAATSATGPAITVAGDARVTRVGRILRKTKIDELPQLFNVLKGDMSLVGPRPEAPKYVELFRADYEEILTCRPGITDLASIRYRNEEGVLAAATDPEREYIERILPDKIGLAKQYVRHSSAAMDLRLLVATLVKIVVRDR
jgi:lipopolysaccharide/colanic/teichoic acid biosynthesis glycosyltransferase